MYLYTVPAQPRSMNLIIDIGNTQVKLAVFNNGSMEFHESIRTTALEAHLSALHERYPIKNSILSNVSRLPEAVMDTLARYPVHVLSHTSRVPFTNRYATPQTLGADRIALTAAAAHRFPGKNVLIIDAGTCITYDFLNAENEYLGGAIAPGIQMRYKALHTFTGRLPLLQPEDFPGITGNTTAASIHSGVLNGCINEIQGVIAQYEKKYKDLTVILTGGDTQLLSERLKNSIFVEPNFLVTGLNIVLEHNKP